MNFNAALAHTWVGGVRTHTAPENDILAELMADITLERRGVLVFTPNIQHIDLFGRDKRFRSVYAKARYVLPDGWPVAAVASLQSRRRIPRIAGSDFMWRALEEARDRGWTVALVGGSQGAGERLRGRLLSSSHGKASVVVEPAPSQELADREQRRALVQRISAKRPEIVLLSLGAPQQELFAGTDLADADVGAVLCIGAGMDFAAGHRRRAPAFIHRLGLEWAWRLALEPGRLGPRYARAAVGFVASLRRGRRDPNGF